MNKKKERKKEDWKRKNKEERRKKGRIKKKKGKWRNKIEIIIKKMKWNEVKWNKWLLIRRIEWEMKRNDEYYY